jgi:hypothetical protein
LKSTVLWLLSDSLPLKNDVKVPSKSNMQKNVQFFVGILKVNYENRRVRIRIRIHQSEALILGSGSGSKPKCHGSATLRKALIRTGTVLWCSRCILVQRTCMQRSHENVLPRLISAPHPSWRRGPPPPAVRSPSHLHTRNSYGQCSGSVLDPDSIRSVHPDPGSESGSRRTKMTHKNIKVKKIHVFKCWMFSFEGWRLLLELGRPFWRPRDK